eukprot:CAMPEP_0197639210 /NCGR_PEP_ID=MMETSP1338-20131121/13900_1 /TAXON_ID=43686 ORGANISM="Pelagodinium beii, Strain RCC1491" /NCGR_SAMPLE_ID=MMETSP1338 /ASSEMBLY_ACC=CAM_ASM_000754 /LENGTH=506 /DNA_ID=CAMNT_0043211903 /DNA_START=33 /DNA_END=1553 /DNA_ORIENTATION=+
MAMSADYMRRVPEFHTRTEHRWFHPPAQAQLFAQPAVQAVPALVAMPSTIAMMPSPMAAFGSPTWAWQWKSPSEPPRPKRIPANLLEYEAQKGTTWFPATAQNQTVAKPMSPPMKACSPSYAWEWRPRSMPYETTRQSVPLQAQSLTQGQSNVDLPYENQAFLQLWSAFSKQQQEAWTQLSQVPEPRKMALLERFTQGLSEDQQFLMQKARMTEEISNWVSRASTDFSSYCCVHFWIGDCGFGSEVNNLVSAALLCQMQGLSCVVHDETWNNGRLHDYLEAEPFILRRCPHEACGRCRPLVVKRDDRQASPGWFSVCKHAREQPMQRKSQLMKQLWHYTSETHKKIAILNEELDLPERYVAIHIRRGDKVQGRCQESLAVTSEVYAAEALTHISPQCNVIAICSDDVNAAKEVDEILKQRDSRVDVRFRSRHNVPGQLRNGHWQADYNSLRKEERAAMTHEFLADVEVLRQAAVCVCTYSSNVGRLVALLRDGTTVSVDHAEWTNC